MDHVMATQVADTVRAPMGDAGKLGELLVYVAARSKDDPRFDARSVGRNADCLEQSE